VFCLLGGSDFFPPFPCPQLNSCGLRISFHPANGRHQTFLPLGFCDCYLSGRSRDVAKGPHGIEGRIYLVSAKLASGAGYCLPDHAVFVFAPSRRILRRRRWQMGKHRQTTCK